MPIEADLEAFSPGRVSAVGVRDRLAEAAIELFEHSCANDSRNEPDS